VAFVEDEIRCFYDGRYQETGRRRRVMNPYDGSTIGDVLEAGPPEVDAAVRDAAEAAERWANTPAYRRAELLATAARELAGVRGELARVITEQTGKVLRQSVAEVDRAVLTLEISARETTRLEGDLHVADAVPGGEGVIAYSVRRPLGVIAAITPFNAPVNLACHKLGPALGVGNTVVWKTPPEVPGVGPPVLDAFRRAGLPEGVVAVVHGGSETGSALVRHPLVAGVSFTGSVAAGRAVHEAVGLRPALLELGGIALNIVHDDADYVRAAASCAAGAFKNAGQSCNSVQRVFIAMDVFEDTVARLIEHAGALTIGDPLDPESEIGPMVSEEAASRVESWLATAVSGGARVLIGGSRTGAIIPPTVVSDVPRDSHLVCKEVFGPVCTVEPYVELEEVWAAAADLSVGLTHAIFTSSIAVAVEAARKLPSGSVFVNRNSNARLDHLPFGGVRDSGVGGREGPRYAMEALSERQLVMIEP
jgi:acyl-CoA reductase-like NAD-dependent aldehyde dehydrogenase